MDLGALISESDLLSLCSRYPEIDFEPEIRNRQLRSPKTQPDAVYSSPISVTAKDDTDTSFQSDSTARTTPLRPSAPATRDRSSRVDVLSWYLRIVEESSLPNYCLRNFTSLAERSDDIAKALFPIIRNRVVSVNVLEVLGICHDFLNQVKLGCTATEEQVKNIKALKGLVAFNTTPSDPYLWSCFRQRAQLIIRYDNQENRMKLGPPHLTLSIHSRRTALPCSDECRLISHLGRLFNTTIYRVVLDRSDHEDYDNAVLMLLHRIYDAVMTWSHIYRQWIKEMKNLKQQYIQPLVDRINASPAVQEEIRILRQGQKRALERIRQSSIIATGPPPPPPKEPPPPLPPPREPPPPPPVKSPNMIRRKPLPPGAKVRFEQDMMI